MSIEIKNIDLEKSYSDGRTSVYHINFRKALTSHEYSAFASAEKRYMADEFQLNQLDTNHVVVTTSTTKEPEEVLGLIQKIANEINTPEESFKKKLVAINQKIGGGN